MAQDSNKQFDWVEFYQEFADKLLPYKNNRQELIAKVRQVFQKNGFKLPTLEKDNYAIIDIDPFTVFGLFNKSKMKMSNRIAIIKAIKQLFEVKASVPTSFDSVPVLFPMNATFYYFIDQRGNDDINDIWEFFSAAMDYSRHGGNREQLFKCFDTVIKLPGVGTSKLTMALYWIGPNTFLNMDRRNIWYLYESGKMPADFVKELPSLSGTLTAQRYFEISDKVNEFLNSGKSEFHSLQELSYEAWRFSEEINMRGEGWIPENYDPCISTAKWQELLANEDVFTPDRLTTLKCFFDYGTPATCTQLAQKYGRTKNYYNVGGSSLAKEVANQLGLDAVDIGEGEMRWWPIVFLGKSADKADAGVFLWKIRDELFEALKKTDLSSVPLYSNESETSGLGGDEARPVHYWLFSPGDNAKIWDECYDGGFMAIGWDRIGDLSSFQTKEEIRQKMQELLNPKLSWKMSAHAAWQFANEMQPGDIVFAKKGMHTIVGKGIVTSDYRFDPSRKSYKNIRSVKWTHKGTWPHPGQAAMKTMTDITPYTDYVEKLNSLFVDTLIDDGDEVDPIPPVILNPPYTPEDFLKDVYMDEASYETLVSLIRKKKNVILQGAPGVGKTYAAKRLAYSMMGEKDAERVMMVQFHQSYSYEDFIMGFRPSEKGFELKHGAFYTFCKKAEEDSDNEYFFIIDEINRGNLSKIFGELFMLIESDKRGVELRLLYANEKFSVPANVYIIGMMNTADRSLALLDYALRRRFAFFEMQPGFETEGFRAYRMALQSERFDKLILCVENLNNAIAADESLGEGFRIGHSYFCNLKEADEQTLSNIVEYELIPLLKEYWFDEPTKVKDWANILRSAIK